jgi:hypothetical protein
MLLRPLLLALPCLAALPAAAQSPASPATGRQSEPVVQRSVIEDDNARIEELRVRGAVRSVKVQPKGPLKAEYEVITPDAGRDITDGPNSAKGTAGQRVWRVLTF